MKKFYNRPELRDPLFVFGLILFSALPYVARLGFYSDDWSYVASLRNSSPSGVAAMFQSLLHTDSGLLVRPVQLACLVAEFLLFGTHPLPYHLLISAMLAAAAVLVYLVLRAIPVARRSSLSIALVFGFLPQYSTDRFWLSSQQAILCIIFALLGIYALLRYTFPASKHRVAWLMFASAAFVLSILSYEVALGLIVAGIILIAFRSFSRRDGHRRITIAGIFGSAAPIFIFGLIKLHLQHRMVVHHRFPRFLLRLDVWKLAAVHAFRFNLWNYLLHLPSVIGNLYRHAVLNPAAISVAAIIAALAALYLWRISERDLLPNWRSALSLMAAGFILFGLGYILFFPVPGSSFESAGLNNRTTIASALGASCVLAALAILLSSTTRSRLIQSRAFALLIGFTCGSYCLVINGIAFYWADAASKQAAILQNVRANVNTLRDESAILLDGFCRYSGPAVVFETDWDATGALRLALDDPTLTSDVVSKNMRFNDTAIDSTMYGEPEGHYPYGGRLFIFNTRAHLLLRVPSREAAVDYLLRFNPDGDSGCPSAVDGDGVAVF